MKKKTGIIVALDVSSLKGADSLIETLAPFVDAFKIGMELCTAESVRASAEAITSRGGQVFLDLKYHDIPNTVASAVRVASEMGIWLINMHVSAGMDAMRAAVAAKRHGSKLIGVTALTSLDDSACMQIYGKTAECITGEFIQMAYDARLDGVVCSPRELRIIRQLPERSEEFISVTPGIRPAWAATNDQKRFMTPREAQDAGADYIVIGRPITNPPDGMTPYDAVMRIREEMSH